MRTPLGRSRAAVLVLGLAAALTVTGYSTSRSAGATAPATQTRQVERVHLEGGRDVVADRRTVTVSVSRTTGLLDRQRVTVSWTGAHPSTENGADPDPRAPSGRNRLFPMVVLQCRGVDSVTAPDAQRLSPQTCFTTSIGERYLQTPCCDAPGSRFPAWRLDRYASPGDRAFVTGAPTPRPAACPAATTPQRWLPFRTPKLSYSYGPNGCGGIAPESTGDQVGSGLPGNAVYAATDGAGNGQALVDVRTTQTNASLGCTDTVPCALVAVPVDGISCDTDASQLPPDQQPSSDSEAAAAAAACTSSDPKSDNQLTMAGGLWWSPSNWRNRLTFPLSFQPLPGSCNLVGQKDGVDVYGSELVVPVTQQWQGKFCSDPKLFPFKHVQTNEPQARNLLRTGNVEAAFTTYGSASPYPRPTATGVVALGGFAIGYVADDSPEGGGLGKPVHDLRLTPRLLAKLLTESYTTGLGELRAKWQWTNGGQTYTTLRTNPVDITQDKEFLALNPRFQGQARNLAGMATLAFLSAQTDLVRALTTYINADPDARAWLDGQSDPYGMKVNPHYQGIALPVDTWPLLDDFSADFGDCKDVPPWLPLTAAPLSRLALLSQHLEYGYDAGAANCVFYGFSNDRVVKTGGYQIAGNRFVIGLTTLADAARYSIDVASLKSGSQFVTPDASSLTAAAAFLRPSPSTPGLFELDAKALAQSQQAAYPGLMPVHLQVPRQGLSAADTARYAALLRYAAGPGQVPGSQPGQLPLGFLPLSAVRSPALAAATLRAADLLSGTSSPKAGTGSGAAGGSRRSAPTTSSPSLSTVGGGASPGAAVAGVPGGSGASAGSPLPPPRALGPTRSSLPTAPPTGLSAAAGSGGLTSDADPGAWGSMLPVLALVALLASLVGAVTGRSRP